MTALAKSGGGVRGIAAGDVSHRLVCRTISQQFGPAAGCSNGSFSQCPLNLRTCECVVHALQALFEIDPTATVMFTDGISAFDPMF